MNAKRIAIIGAGMAGLVCADRLRALGAAVTVFEKSGDIGGRLASRRRQGASWNHGAPAVHAREAAFAEFLRELISGGSARALADRDGEAFVGQPDMREMLRPLAKRLDIHCSMRVERLCRSGSGWRLALAGGPAAPGPFDVVLATQPAPQIAQLLGDSRLGVPAGLDRVTMLPCWTLLLGFAEAVDCLGEVSAGTVFEQAMRQGPAGGSTLPDRWVLQTAQPWTDVNLELDKHAAERELMDALRALVGDLPPVVYRAAHRWRYALVQKALGISHLWLPELGLGCAGDWCLGGDAESAFLSGSALARAVSALEPAA